MDLAGPVLEGETLRKTRNKFALVQGKGQRPRSQGSGTIWFPLRVFIEHRVYARQGVQVMELQQWTERAGPCHCSSLEEETR